MASEPVRVAGRTIYFADGYSTEIDVIVYATGFSPVFGFLEQSLETAGGHEFELYKRVFRPVIDSLFFVGSFLPALSGTRAAAMQVVLVAEYLSGAYALPELFTMRNQPHYDRGRTATRLFDSDPTRGGPALARYIADLEGELRRGRRRALRDGVRPPLPVVASSLRPQAEPWQAVTDSATRTRQSGQEPHKHEQAAARTAAA